MEIWLIRHGTTLANLEGRIQGRLDYPLSPQGHREAKLLAQRLRFAGLDCLFSSDLRRARETAQIIAVETGIKPVQSHLLRESSWGILEGLTRAEIQSLRLTSILTDKRQNLKAISWGGESERKLLSRARLYLKMVEYECHGYNRIASVSHGRFINALIVAALGLKTCRRWPFAPDPASLSVISRRAGQGSYRLDLFNDRCHLEIN